MTTRRDIQTYAEIDARVRWAHEARAAMIAALAGRVWRALTGGAADPAPAPSPYRANATATARG